MATLQQRRKRNIVVMVVALVVVVAAYIGISVYQAQKEKAALGVELSKNSAEDFTKFVYRRQGEETVELEKKDGRWVNLNYPDVPVLQDKVTNMAEQLTVVLAKQKLKETDLASFGLTEPAIIMEATTASGEKVKINFGARNAAGLGYYATYNGGSDIYLLENPYFDAFNYSDGQLMQVETVRQLTQASIRGLRWVHKDGMTMEMTYNESESEAHSKLFITEPYNGQVRVNTTELNSLVTKLNNMVYAECVDYDCQDFSQYGFDEPTLHLEIQWLAKDGNVYDYVLELGAQREDEYYYVRTSDSNNVNLYSGTDAKALMRSVTFDYVYETLFYGDEELLESVTVEADGTVYKASSSDSDFADIREAITSIKIDGEADASIANTDNKVYTITVDGGQGVKDVWTFYEYDGRSLYLLDINGKDQSFVTTKRSVDDFVELLK